MSLSAKSISVLIAAVLLCAFTPVQAAITIINADGGGEGLNDTTAASPVGGNTGTTIGQQRLNVFNRAAAILNATFDITQPVQVSANFDPLYCTSSSATLGSAGPAQYHFLYDSGTSSYTVFADALVNQLNGSDLDPATVDISANFNSELGNSGCLDGYGWYLGFDAPTGTLNSLLSVVLHEIIHGMGFLSLLQSNGVSGATYGGSPVYDPYTKLLYDGTQGALLTSLNDTQRAAAMLNNGNLLWDGTQTNAQLGGLSAGVNSGRMQMYAPVSYESGSSVSHFDTAATPNELMEPQYTEFLDTAGLARFLLADIGWTLQAGNSAPIINTITAQTMDEDGTLNVALSATDADGDSLTYSIVSAAADFGASISGSTLTFTPTANYHGSGTVTVQVSDGTDTASTSFTLTINAVNDAPVMAAISSQTVAEDGTLSLSLSATDVDGDTLTYSLVSAPANPGVSVTGTTLTATPAANYNGSGTVTVQVSDGSTTDSTSFTLTVTAVNDAPVFNLATTTYSVTDGDTQTITLSGTDVDGDTLNFSLDSFDSSAISASLSGAVLTINADQSATGATTVDVSVSDGSLSDSATLSINILAANNQAPVWDALTTVTMLAGTSDSLTLSATDPDGDALIYSVTSAPAGITATVTGSTLDITAAGSAAGNFSIALRVTDGGMSADTTLSVTILPAFTLTASGSSYADGSTISAGTASLSFTLLGGDNSLSTTLFYNSADVSTTLLSKSGSTYTLAMPTAGAFAGDYTLSVTDSLGNSATFYLERPLKVTSKISPLLIISGGTQTLTIEGAVAGSGISLSSSDSALTFSNDNGDAITMVTAVDDSETFNATDIILQPDNSADFSATVTLSATNVPDTLKTLNFLLPKTVTFNISDISSAAINNALVSISDNRFSSWNLPTSATTNSSGIATLQLPEESLSVQVSATDYQSKTVTVSPAEVSKNIQLSEAGNAFILNGIVQASGFNFLNEEPVIELVFTDRSRETLEHTVINSTSVRFRWEGDLSIAQPNYLRVSHSLSVTTDTSINTSLSSQDVRITMTGLSSNTNATTVVVSSRSSSSSSGGGFSMLALMLLSPLLIALRRRHF